jgi:hypothetical protein
MKEFLIQLLVQAEDEAAAVKPFKKYTIFSVGERVTEEIQPGVKIIRQGSGVMMTADPPGQNRP